ncbi:MAG: transglycosylase SLT domain-containing protein [Thiothrix sp.]|uniref:lytic transglycosylase domain-containing protein n=1 Tax=Thiothrix sp. TaxID=1032 RepID=UPI002611FDE0|nr:lytic transglycosylase domain-containing protein [Thiothrix sp.]MDD5391768.1 transglycosylase SLT domain-containing protein [Thiothrix sp.]
MTKKLLTSLCVSLFCAVLAQAAAVPEDQASLFLQVRADLQAGKVDTFVALPPTMRQYPLYPWLEYEYIKQSLGGIPDQQLLAFALRNPGSLMADDVYAALAKRLTEKQDWQGLLNNIPAELDDTDVLCYRTQALAATGQKDAALEVGKQAWLGIEKSITPACAPVTVLLRNHVKLSTEDYWQRIRVAIDKKQTSLAAQLAADLPPDQQAAVALWIQVRKDPLASLPTVLQQADSPYVREIIAFALERIAKKESQTAESTWLAARQKFKFTPAESGRVESALGMYQALRHDAAAIPRLVNIPAENRTQDGSLWLARIAARQSDWNSVLQATQQLTFDNERDAAGWKYWQARALEQTGKTQEAASLYANIAPQATFYGFLASDRLGQGYSGLNDPPVDRSQRVAGLQKLAAIQRVFAWFALGDRAQGRKEWFRTLQQMDKDGKLAAAELATRTGDPNLAIWTLSRSKEWGEINLRFPLVHTDLVQEQARNQGLQPAWIFGVMRRESAFDANAESGANAFGLMQLILPTARAVGRKLGLTISSKDDVLQPATNVQLGSAYLREMLGKFNGNYAQATAAYNAGPGRPPQWAPSSLINADQWIESIPFTETRDYVQAVMTYTTIYDYKLNEGKGIRLSERLLPIAPNAPPKTAQP